MRDISSPDDWEPITPFGTAAESKAALEAWQRQQGIVIAEADLRLDIGRGAGGQTIYRYQRRRPQASRDIGEH